MSVKSQILNIAETQTNTKFVLEFVNHVDTEQLLNNLVYFHDCRNTMIEFLDSDITSKLKLKLITDNPKLHFTLKGNYAPRIYKFILEKYLKDDCDDFEIPRSEFNTDYNTYYIENKNNTYNLEKYTKCIKTGLIEFIGITLKKNSIWYLSFNKNDVIKKMLSYGFITEDMLNKSELKPEVKINEFEEENKKLKEENNTLRTELQEMKKELSKLKLKIQTDNLNKKIDDKINKPFEEQKPKIKVKEHDSDHEEQQEIVNKKVKKYKPVVSEEKMLYRMKAEQKKFIVKEEEIEI